MAEPSANYVPTLETIRSKHRPDGDGLYTDDEIEILLDAVAERDLTIATLTREYDELWHDCADHRRVPASLHARVAAERAVIEAVAAHRKAEVFHAAVLLGMRDGNLVDLANLADVVERRARDVRIAYDALRALTARPEAT